MENTWVFSRKHIQSFDLWNFWETVLVYKYSELEWVAV